MKKIVYVLSKMAVLLFWAPQLVCFAADLDFPILDYPFNGFPSMSQSLMLTRDYYQISHGFFSKQIEPPVLKGIASSAFDVLTYHLPLGSTWLHEEWHRAVLGRRGILSYDEIYRFRLFQPTVFVSHVSDEALVRLKQEHPEEMIHLSSAGIEATYELNLELEKLIFFRHDTSWYESILFLNALKNSLYLMTCASSRADKITETMNAKDGSEVLKRDFAGLDCTAWTYDLFRQNEAYANRGIHPSGVGINRYRSYSNLTEQEQLYLKKQFHLSFINFLDPYIVGKNYFESQFLGQHLFWNANFRYFLTSFGGALDINLFVAKEQTKFLLRIHQYLNQDKYFPGIEVQFFDSDSNFRIALWNQPESFQSNSGFWGGLVSAKLVEHFSGSFKPYLQMTAKSRGWVAGEVYLNSSVSLVAGFLLSFLN